MWKDFTLVQVERLKASEDLAEEVSFFKEKQRQWWCCTRLVGGRLEAPIALRTDELAVVDEAVVVLVVHLQYGINHLLQLKISEDLGCAVRWRIGAHLFALFDVPVNERLDELTAVEHVVVVIVVHLEVVKLQLLLRQLAHVLVAAQRLVQVLLQVLLVVDARGVVEDVAAGGRRLLVVGHLLPGDALGVASLRMLLLLGLLSRRNLVVHLLLLLLLILLWLPRLLLVVYLLLGSTVLRLIVVCKCCRPVTGKKKENG